MICDVICIAAGTVGMLVGQAIPQAELGNVLQGSAFAVLAYAFLHLIVKTLPQRDRQYTESVNLIADSQAQATRELAAAIIDLRLNCAARFVEDKQQH